MSGSPRHLWSLLIIVAVVQIILMLARGGMLVVLTGILPLSAAAAMSGESGKGWFNKNVAWLVAFILYKPAAAIMVSPLEITSSTSTTWRPDARSICGISILT